MLPYPIFHCPSSLLSPCIPFPKNYQVLLGCHNLKPREEKDLLIQVNHSFPHSYFNFNLLEKKNITSEDDTSHDHMLLCLKEPAQITDAVMVLDLPTREPEVEITCAVLGWGSNNQINVSLGEDVPRGAQAPGSKGGEDWVPELLGLSEEDALEGDSGGPPISDEMLQGIMSVGNFPCGIYNFPSIFTKLIPYMQSINDTMAASP
nr:kallikrein-1-like [Loxodonta africana]